MNKIDVGKTKFDVDIKKYEYLNPIWTVLNEIPHDSTITAQELWEKTGLDPERGNRLLREFSQDFMNVFAKHFLSLLFSKKELTHSWTFDKVMLLCTRIDTGNTMSLPDNPVMNQMKQEWMKNRMEKQGT